MVLTPHALIGAAIYTFVPNPWIGFPLAFFSHFAADWVPHNHYHAKNSEDGEFVISLNNFLKLAVDFAVGMALCTVVAWRQQNFLFIGAGFLAMLPDTLSFFELLYKEHSLPAKKTFLPPLQLIRRFHRRIHAKEDPRTLALVFLQPAIAIVSLLIGIWR